MKFRAMICAVEKKEESGDLLLVLKGNEEQHASSNAAANLVGRVTLTAPRTLFKNFALGDMFIVSVEKA